MKTYVLCLKCNWRGIKKQLMSPKYLQDFYHCPECESGFTELLFYKKIRGAWYSSCNDYEYQEIEDVERIRKLYELLESIG